MTKLKRAYDAASKGDGLRILVERLWPRGVTKQKAAIDLWLKDVAPTTELRKWYGHDPARWPKFRKRYWAALKDQNDVVALRQEDDEERKLLGALIAISTGVRDVTKFNVPVEVGQRLLRCYGDVEKG